MSHCKGYYIETVNSVFLKIKATNLFVARNMAIISLFFTFFLPYCSTRELARRFLSRCFYLCSFIIYFICRQKYTFIWQWIFRKVSSSIKIENIRNLFVDGDHAYPGCFQGWRFLDLLDPFSVLHSRLFVETKDSNKYLIFSSLIDEDINCVSREISLFAELPVYVQHYNY